MIRSLRSRIGVPLEIAEAWSRAAADFDVRDSGLTADGRGWARMRRLRQQPFFLSLLCFLPTSVFAVVGCLHKWLVAGGDLG